TWIMRVQSIAPTAVTSAVPPPAPGQAPVAVAADSMGGPNVKVSIDGRTVDIQAYTTFLRQLAASPWFTDVTPANSQVVIEADRLQVIVDAAKRDLASGTVEDLRRRVEEYQGSLELMRRLVPERNEVPTLIDDITTRAKVRGVTLGKFSPLSPEPGSPFDTYRYRLEVYGHYDQIREYIADIASLPRIVVPEEVNLSAATPAAQKLLGDTLGAL